MFEKQLDGQMAPEKRDHGNLAVKARYTHFTIATTRSDFSGSLLTKSRFCRFTALTSLDFAGSPVTESRPQSMLVHMISSSHSGAKLCHSSHKFTNGQLRLL